jgi:DNA-binding NtrC family response regulator
MKFLGKTSCPHRKVIELVEKALIEKALEMSGGNKSEAAKLLGISRNTLRERLAYYKIKIPSKLYRSSRILRGRHDED